MVATNFLALWKHAFVWVKEPDGTWRGLTLLDLCGPSLYLLPLVSTALWFGLFLLAVHNRKTIEKDANNNRYAEDWDAAGPVHRLYLTNALRIGYIIGACLIAAALAK